MNVVAKMTLRALAEHGEPLLPAYRRALISACNEFPPPFGTKAYGDLYRKSASDAEWLALSLATHAESEGDGAEHLWDLAASTRDADAARQLQQHAIDESRHSRAYVTLLDLVFPGAVERDVLRQLHGLSPSLTKATPLRAKPGSSYAHSATVDDFIQMNIAEIRTRIHHILQRPVLMKYCKAERRERVRRILDSLLLDETRHVAYTARLIEREARETGADVVGLMRERVKDFNAITDDEVGRRTLRAA
jgi:hypothetical protein